MTTIDELDRKLGDHMLEDAERHGVIIANMAEIKGDLKYLVKQQEAQEDKLEKTGDHDVAVLQKRADFWPNVVKTIVVSLITAGITGLVVFWTTHR